MKTLTLAFSILLMSTAFAEEFRPLLKAKVYNNEDGTFRVSRPNMKIGGIKYYLRYDNCANVCSAFGGHFLSCTGGRTQYGVAMINELGGFQEIDEVPPYHFVYYVESVQCSGEPAVRPLK